MMEKYAKKDELVELTRRCRSHSKIILVAFVLIFIAFIVRSVNLERRCGELKRENEALREDVQDLQKKFGNLDATVSCLEDYHL